MGWWLFPWPRRANPRVRLEIVLYSRRGCHLCDDAESLLRHRQKQFGYEFVKIDVDADSHLIERYGKCVPVVLVDGKIRFRGRLEPVLFDRLLNASG